jgi:3-deoxy-D-manno-octulosonate 8-phosphate phosphatase KdsC-like HAD superfamily phosphatase
MTVSDATDEAIAAALFVTKKKGGEGAVREICDLIVAAKG